MEPQSRRPHAGADEPTPPALSLPGAHSYQVLAPGAESAPRGTGPAGEQTLELREEQLIARKDLRERGEIRLRTTVEEIPGRLEVEVQREEVEIEHIPAGQVVSEREGPYEQDGSLMVPIYEEQLVVVKRLVLKEQLRVRRVTSTKRQLFEDTLRRDRLVIEDPQNTQLVHEQYPTDEKPSEERAEGTEHQEAGRVDKLRKALQ
jgi:uncharacterized protein (TIGR02271 family)